MSWTLTDVCLALYRMYIFMQKLYGELCWTILISPHIQFLLCVLTSATSTLNAMQFYLAAVKRGIKFSVQITCICCPEYQYVNDSSHFSNVYLNCWNHCVLDNWSWSQFDLHHKENLLTSHGVNTVEFQLLILNSSTQPGVYFSITRRPLLV